MATRRTRSRTAEVSSDQMISSSSPRKTRSRAKALAECSSDISTATTVVSTRTRISRPSNKAGRRAMPKPTIDDGAQPEDEEGSLEGTRRKPLEEVHLNTPVKTTSRSPVKSHISESVVKAPRSAEPTIGRLSGGEGAQVFWPSDCGTNTKYPLAEIQEDIFSQPMKTPATSPYGAHLLSQRLTCSNRRQTERLSPVKICGNNALANTFQTPPGPMLSNSLTVLPNTASSFMTIDGRRVKIPEYEWSPIKQNIAVSVAEDVLATKSTIEECTLDRTSNEEVAFTPFVTSQRNIAVEQGINRGIPEFAALDRIDTGMFRFSDANELPIQAPTLQLSDLKVDDESSPLTRLSLAVVVGSQTVSAESPAGGLEMSDILTSRTNEKANYIDNKTLEINEPVLPKFEKETSPLGYYDQYEIQGPISCTALVQYSIAEDIQLECAPSAEWLGTNLVSEIMNTEIFLGSHEAISETRLSEHEISDIISPINLETTETGLCAEPTYEFVDPATSILFMTSQVAVVSSEGDPIDNDECLVRGNESIDLKLPEIDINRALHCRGSLTLTDHTCKQIDTICSAAINHCEIIGDDATSAVDTIKSVDSAIVVWAAEHGQTAPTAVETKGTDNIGDLHIDERITSELLHCDDSGEQILCSRSNLIFAETMENAVLVSIGPEKSPSSMSAGDTNLSLDSPDADLSEGMYEGPELGVNPMTEIPFVRPLGQQIVEPQGFSILSNREGPELLEPTGDGDQSVDDHCKETKTGYIDTFFDPPRSKFVGSNSDCAGIAVFSEVFEMNQELTPADCTELATLWPDNSGVLSSTDTSVLSRSNTTTEIGQQSVETLADTHEITDTSVEIASKVFHIQNATVDNLMHIDADSPLSFVEADIIVSYENDSTADVSCDKGTIMELVHHPEVPVLVEVIGPSSADDAFCACSDEMELSFARCDVSEPFHLALPADSSLCSGKAIAEVVPFISCQEVQQSRNIQVAVQALEMDFVAPSAFGPENILIMDDVCGSETLQDHESTHVTSPQQSIKVAKHRRQSRRQSYMTATKTAVRERELEQQKSQGERDEADMRFAADIETGRLYVEMPGSVEKRRNKRRSSTLTKTSRLSQAVVNRVTRSRASLEAESFSPIPMPKIGSFGSTSAVKKSDAAILIQKVVRGYFCRKHLSGLDVDGLSIDESVSSGDEGLMHGSSGSQEIVDDGPQNSSTLGVKETAHSENDIKDVFSDFMKKWEMKKAAKAKVDDFCASPSKLVPSTPKKPCVGALSPLKYVTGGKDPTVIIAPSSIRAHSKNQTKLGPRPTRLPATKLQRSTSDSVSAISAPGPVELLSSVESTRQSVGNYNEVKQSIPVSTKLPRMLASTEQEVSMIIKPALINPRKREGEVDNPTLRKRPRLASRPTLQGSVSSLPVAQVRAASMPSVPTLATTHSIGSNKRYAAVSAPTTPKRLSYLTPAEIVKSTRDHTGQNRLYRCDFDRIVIRRDVPRPPSPTAKVQAKMASNARTRRRRMGKDKGYIFGAGDEEDWEPRQITPTRKAVRWFETLEVDLQTLPRASPTRSRISQVTQSCLGSVCELDDFGNTVLAKEPLTPIIGKAPKIVISKFLYRGEQDD